ncbi:MAG: NTP transferase domain-containing protein [Planctomycetaceae bacterium]|nr:NTP transferase domain-containing protein [Planctomycetaceae bacterium]
MLKHLGIVEACFRTPKSRSNAARRLGGRSLIEWVIRRVTDSIRLDGVIVVASGSEDGDVLRRLVPSDVPVFISEGQDALARFCRALERYPAEGVVRVRGENLFVDPGLIDRLVTTAEAQPGCDYVSYRSRDGRPAIQSPASVYAEWFRVAALREANRAARDPAEREQVTQYLSSRPEKFRICQIPAPQAIDRDDVRLLVDIEEDWDHALMLYEALGPDHWDWQRVVGLLDHQPAMRNRMAALNRVHAQA